MRRVCSGGIAHTGKTRRALIDASCAWPMLAGNLRWVAVHMIEETARHNGHLDIYRELIDGQTDRD